MRRTNKEFQCGITYRRLVAADLARIGEIDRTERIETLYVQHGTRLEKRVGDWSADAWFSDGESLSWLRDADHRNLPLPHVDFFYSTAGAAPFGEELAAIADHHPSLRLHLNDTSAQPRLNGASMLAATAAEPAGLSVFMCGPTAMLRDLRRQLKSAAVLARQLRHEYFDWR